MMSSSRIFEDKQHDQHRYGSPRDTVNDGRHRNSHTRTNDFADQNELAEQQRFARGKTKIYQGNALFGALATFRTA